MAALIVAVAIGILLIVLQPGPKPTRRVAEEATGTTTSSTSTLPPGVQLCSLAKRFVQDAEGLEPHDVARIAEVFYIAAVKLVDDGPLRAEFDATARYYVEFNEIGTEFDYDVFRIAAAGKGDRWTQLLLRPPLGIETARAAIEFACEVAVPPPPILTTVPPTFTQPRDESSGASGAGASGPVASGTTPTPARTSPGE